MRETEPITFCEVATMLREFWATVKRLPGYVKWSGGTIIVIAVFLWSL